MWEREKQSGVKFVGIGLLDKKEAVQAFVRRHHLTFPNGYDGDRKIAKLYGFTYKPYWAVIDKAGGCSGPDTARRASKSSSRPSGS